jgi:hypothetical protein
VPLNCHAAGDPRVSRAGLDHHSPAIGELGAGDLGQVPGTEQHSGRASAEMAIAPFGEENVIGHDDQYRPRPPSGRGD